MGTIKPDRVVAVPRRTIACGLAGAAAACAVAVGAGAVLAQDYPVRPVRMIVPFAPGGPTDVIARILGQRLSEALGQQVVIDNRAGAGGNIGMGLAAKAAPDGYTVLIVSSSFVVNPSLYAKVPYDPFKDFIPVTYAAASPNLLSVHPSSPARSVKELEAMVRAQPGKHNFASPGTGTTPHLSGELFRLVLKLDLAHIPFNGAGPAVQAVISGQVPIGFTALPPAQPHVKAGTLRGLAVTSARRSGAVPDLPTMAEAGYPNMESDTLQGVLVPAGTPRAVVDRLHAEFVRVVNLPEVRERIVNLGFDPVANRPEAFAAQIRSEIERWGKVIREAQIKAE